MDVPSEVANGAVVFDHDEEYEEDLTMTHPVQLAAEAAEEAAVQEVDDAEQAARQIALDEAMGFAKAGKDLHFSTPPFVRVRVRVLCASCTSDFFPLLQPPVPTSIRDKIMYFDPLCVPLTVFFIAASAGVGCSNRKNLSLGNLSH